MWATAAPARAASMAASAISSGRTGTRSLARAVSPAPVTAHVMNTSGFTDRSSRGSSREGDSALCVKGGATDILGWGPGRARRPHTGAMTLRTLLCPPLLPPAAAPAAHAATIASDPTASEVTALDGTVVWVSGPAGAQTLMQRDAAGTRPVQGA